MKIIVLSKNIIKVLLSIIEISLAIVLNNKRNAQIIKNLQKHMCNFTILINDFSTWSFLSEYNFDFNFSILNILLFFMNILSLFFNTPFIIYIFILLLNIIRLHYYLDFWFPIWFHDFVNNNNKPLVPYNNNNVTLYNYYTGNIDIPPPGGDSWWKRMANLIKEGVDNTKEFAKEHKVTLVFAGVLVVSGFSYLFYCNYCKDYITQANKLQENNKENQIIEHISKEIIFFKNKKELFDSEFNVGKFEKELSILQNENLKLLEESKVLQADFVELETQFIKKEKILRNDLCISRYKDNNLFYSKESSWKNLALDVQNSFDNIVNENFPGLFSIVARGELDINMYVKEQEKSAHSILFQLYSQRPIKNILEIKDEKEIIIFVDDYSQYLKKIIQFEPQVLKNPANLAATILTEMSKIDKKSFTFPLKQKYLFFNLEKNLYFQFLWAKNMNEAPWAQFETVVQYREALNQKNNENMGYVTRFEYLCNQFEVYKNLLLEIYCIEQKLIKNLKQQSEIKNNIYEKKLNIELKQEILEKINNQKKIYDNMSNDIISNFSKETLEKIKNK